MSNRHRTILPQPTDLPPDPSREPSLKSYPKRRSVIPTACQSCRQRRSKCDGNTPCTPCVSKGSNCVYEGQPGISRAAAQRERIDRIKFDNASLLEVFWFLQTRSTEDSQELLEFARAQSPGDFNAISRWLKSRTSTGSSSVDEAQGLAYSSSASTSGHAMSPAVPKHSSGSPSSSRQRQRPPDRSAPVLPACHESQTHDIRDSEDTLKWREYATVTMVIQSVKMFLKCTGLLFHVYEEEDMEKIIKDSLGTVEDPDVTVFLDVFRADPSMRHKYAELAGMASVGMLYLRVRSGHHLDGLPSDELAQHFYDVARWMLDSTIDRDPLQAMKLCVLLAMYNIVLKATVALVYVDLGIGLGRQHGMNSRHHPSEFTPQQWEDHERTWRTLLLFSGWLGASLGFVPGEVEPTLLLPTVSTNKRREYIVQTEMVKITILKAKTIRALQDESIVPDVIIGTLRGELRSIHNDLPDWMSMKSLTDKRSPAHLRPVIMYVHLFYLSALQLLHRRVIKLGKVHISGIGNELKNSQQAVAEGLVAARMAAKFLDLMTVEGQLDQLCWLCIFSSYTTAVILLQATVQKVLHGFSPEYWTADFDLASSCLKTLDICAQVDQIAVQFRDLLKVFFHIFEEIVDGELKAIPRQPDPVEDNGPYLFAILEGDTTLHKLARDLLRLIRQPFEQHLEVVQPVGLVVPTPRQTMVNSLEAAMGASMEWIKDLQAYRDELSQHDAEMESDNEMLGMEVMSAVSPGKFVEEPETTSWSMWTPR